MTSLIFSILAGILVGALSFVGTLTIVRYSNRISKWKIVFMIVAKWTLVILCIYAFIKLNLNILAFMMSLSLIIAVLIIYTYRKYKSEITPSTNNKI